MHQKADKLAVTRALLLNSPVFIHLNPRVEGVVVPPYLAEAGDVVFHFGLDTPIPIPDLNLDTDGIRGTLNFNGNPFFCDVPWDAVFAIFNENGAEIVWPGSIPSGLRDKKKPRKPTSTLKVVSSNKDPIRLNKPKPTPRLRVIKGST